MSTAGGVSGGRSVAKILVADDNSNIQKMVGLALKDHGIEVVAVGNGEAAVRKITEIRPDLVLADVFMPVRNGYEVCQYVKQDSSLSHIPVILLVGAFDPLDEAEAQRVGADGVLKKPFVPPDPLIAMVKSSLVRAGIAHVGFSPTPPPSAEPEPAPPIPKFSAPAWSPRPPTAPAPEDESESFVEEIPVAPPAVNIESGSGPLAFGSLLETPAAAKEEVAAEPADTVTAMGLQRDWRALDEAEDEVAEETGAPTPSWRRDSAGNEGDELAAKLGRSGHNWRSGDSPDAPNHSQRSWSPANETVGASEAAATTETANASKESTADFSASAPSAPFSGDAWAAAIATESSSKTAVAEAERPEESVTEVQAEPQSLASANAKETAQATDTVHAPEAAPEIPASEPELPSKATSWFSTPPSPWEAEARKLSQLASAWDTAAPAQPEPPAAAPSAAFAGSDEIEVVSAASISSGNAFEQVPGHDSQFVATAETPAPVRREEYSGSALDVDAIVSKVLAKLSPDVLQEVAGKLLKPIVEAAVREELDSRKH
jgi:CheY-like chemotaxis protein